MGTAGLQAGIARNGAPCDPFDRMLIAQALSHDLILVPSKTVFDRCGVHRRW